MDKITNKRVCAILIDWVIVMFINILVNRLLEFPSPLLVTSCIEFMYFLFKDSLLGGRSIGKRIVGIRVVNMDGNKSTFGQAALRNLPWVIPVLNVVFFAVEFLVMAISKDRRRLGDRFAKTKVIDDRPQIKDSLFILFSILIILVFFLFGPYLLFLKTAEKGKQVVAMLDDFKRKNGVYPAKIQEIKAYNTLFYNFIYSRYSFNSESEFYLTGSASPHPRIISYSSQRKEWRIHRNSMAWSKEEMGITPSFEKAFSIYREGVALQEKGSLDNALESLREALSTEPSCLDCRLGLALVLKQKGLFEESIKQYQEVLRVKPNNPEANLSLSQIFLDQGRYKEALGAYRKYIELNHPRDEAQKKKSDELIRFMDEKMRAVDRAQESKVDVAVVEEKPPMPQKVPQGLIGKLEVGKKYWVSLKNGQGFSARLVEKDAAGLWLELEGGKVYFAADEIIQAHE